MRFLPAFIALSFSIAIFADNHSWYDEYKRALRLPETSACKIFRKLAEDSSVPVHLLAEARGIQACGEDRLTRLQEILTASDKEWSRPLVSQLAFQLAKQQSDKSALLQLIPDYLKYNEFRRQKEEALLTGIETANELSDLAAKEKFEKELWQLSPRLRSDPPEETWFAAAEDYKLNRQWQKAVEVFQKIFENRAAWDDRLKALDGIRRSLKEKFRDPAAGGTLEEFLDSSRHYGEYAFEIYKSRRPDRLEEQRQLALAWLQYGRDIWSYAAPEQQKAGVRQVIEKFLALKDNHPFLRASAFHLAARVSQNYKEYGRGMDESQRAGDVLESIGNHQQWNSWQKELHNDVLWMNAFLTRKTGNLRDSLTKMKRVAQHSSDEWARRRGLFWVGRTLKQLGGNDEALAAYHRLIESDPFHYYALWARYDAGIAADPITPAESSSPQIPEGISEADHQLILSLVKAGELKLARIHLNTLLPPASQQLSHLLYRHFIGDHSTVLQAFFAMPTEEKEKFLAAHTSILYPTPYLPLVQQSAGRWPHIDQHYVYSIMRQESAFNPFAHSWADARGLLQLVPRVAEAEKKKAGISYQSLEELYLPEVNIPLGASALDTRFLLNYNSYIISTGSYNAGEERVHSWWKNLYTGDVFEFLEDIPTEETRLYIRLVANNYFTYLRLHSGQPVNAPAWLFELGPMPAGFLRQNSTPTNPRDVVEPEIFTPVSDY